MGTSYHSVLQQLEDLRLAEWADQAPPPPTHPGHRNQQQGPSNSSPHTYANYPAQEERRGGKGYSDTDPIYQPGQYAVSILALVVFLLLAHSKVSLSFILFPS